MFDSLGISFSIFVSFCFGLIVAYYLICVSPFKIFSKFRKGGLPSSYYKGFNFLLNEQSEEAVVALQQALKEKADNFEIQLSLGNLFRRKGDIQHAIQIHQKLLEQEGLENYSYALVMLELGQDFYTSGLYDRAESIFLEIVNGQHLQLESAKFLLDIYEREKDWRLAIKLINKHFANDERFFNQLSHYYCEIADISLDKGNYDQAYDLLLQASDFRPQNVRSDIQQGKVLAARGEHEKAMLTWQKVIEKNRSYLHEVLYLIMNSFDVLKLSKKKEDYLRYLVEELHSHRALLLLAKYLYDNKGYIAARDILRKSIYKFPSLESVRYLLELRINEIKNKGEDNIEVTVDEMISFTQLLESLQSAKHEYQCRSCGFSTEGFYWQCSSCRSWSSVYAIARIE